MPENTGGSPLRLRYFPEVFEVRDLDSAKAVILTDEGPGADTHTRWEGETPYVLELIAQHLAPRPGMLILDYGCGVGRLARPLIEKFNCHVLGVDISATMRALAAEYVADDRFLAISPSQLDTLVDGGLRVHAALSVWVLQHCLKPVEDIDRIRRAMAPGGRGFVLNMRVRAMPTVEESSQAPRFHWASDGLDIGGLLRESFTTEAEGAPEPGRAPNMTDAGAFWMRFRR